ncbi:unnamed protein product [Lymnaea stagnalis]|uniref:EGF-like domain-containing protein n=1 Tax=Lymnaea stagnalis TaxID=6523 RepID=A0AAV2H7X1_LYMST
MMEAKHRTSTDHYSKTVASDQEIIFSNPSPSTAGVPRSGMINSNPVRNYFSSLLTMIVYGASAPLRVPSSLSATKTVLSSAFTDKTHSNLPRNFFRDGAVSFLLLFVFLSTFVVLAESRSVGVCNGIPCANGGRLLVSNSVWGNCRCRCPSGFVGPYCQYQAARKRSADTATRRSERSEVLERIRQRLLAISERLTARQQASETEMGSEFNDNQNEVGDPENSSAVEETSLDSFNYNRPRRSWTPDY